MDDVGPWVPGTMVFAYGNRVSGGPMGRYARLALAEREEIVLLRRGGLRRDGRSVFCQVGVGRFGVSFSPCERRVSGRFGVGRSCWLLVIALVIA